MQKKECKLCKVEFGPITIKDLGFGSGFALKPQSSTEAPKVISKSGKYESFITMKERGGLIQYPIILESTTLY